MNPDERPPLGPPVEQYWLVLDDAGQILTANTAVSQLAKRSAADLVGRPWVELLDQFSRAKAGELLDRTRRLGHVAGWELDQARPNALPLLMSYTATLLYDTARQPSGFALIGHDLTAKMDLTARLADTNQQLEGALLQLEQAHAQLQITQAQLVHSEKMRAIGQMVAGVAHEINNPAAYVANNLAHLARRLPALRALFEAYAALRPLAGPDHLAALAAAEQAAEAGYLWQELPDLLRESQDGVERIRGIVLSLRNFARLDEADLTVADLNEGLQSTVRLIRPLCVGQVEIGEAYGPLPPLLCRPGELNQVFLNLLTNAIQSIPGLGQVWVTSALAGDHITITIRDTGTGMDAATLAKLGEPFFTTKPVGAGTGLGLAISLAVVARHRGRVRFESEPGLGTTASIDLPVTHEPTGPTPAR